MAKKDLTKCYPRLDCFSPAFMFSAVPLPKNKKRSREPDQYVEIPRRYFEGPWSAQREVFVTNWNWLYECEDLRAQANVLEFPPKLAWLKKYSLHNLTLVAQDAAGIPRIYSNLVHLLPLSIREKYNLSFSTESWSGEITKGSWPIIPYGFCLNSVSKLKRLQSAFSEYIWPFLSSSSKRVFAKDYSLVLLSNSLDFWATHLDRLIRDLVEEFPRVGYENKQERIEIEKLRQHVSEEMIIEKPRCGGMLWMGEEEAKQITRKLVNRADGKGSIRQVIDCIKSNSISDDFSDIWSHEKEDFERRFYHKRNKVKVNFVETLDDLPCYSSRSQLEEGLTWEDLMAMVSPKDRRIVVLLRKGISRYSEIAKMLGYANHSPVSKAMKRIQLAAKQLLED